MAASSLVRLFIVLLILTALALSSGIAWGSFTLLDAPDEGAAATVESVEFPSWPFGHDGDAN